MLSRGTASYRAPELFCEHPMFTKRVDIWAVGCILYEIVSGKPDFQGDWEVYSFSLNHKEITVSHSSLSSAVKNDLADVVKQILQRDPPNRPTATDIRELFNQRISLLIRMPQEAIRTALRQLNKELRDLQRVNAQLFVRFHASVR